MKGHRPVRDEQLAKVLNFNAPPAKLSTLAFHESESGDDRFFHRLDIPEKDGPSNGVKVRTPRKFKKFPRYVSGLPARVPYRRG